MGYLRRQLITGLLTANAVSPLRGNLSPLGFAVGWPTSELAPQILTLTALDTAQAVVRGKASRAGLLLAAGCSAPVADVSGTVTVGGRPVPSGKVAFICDGGTKPVLSVDIKDGRYTVTGVPAGKVTITV